MRNETERHWIYGIPFNGQKAFWPIDDPEATEVVIPAEEA